MAQPDPRASQAVLIGVSRYADLPDLPAVEQNLTDLRRLLTDPEVWGLPPENCTVLGSADLDRPDARSVVLRALHEAGTRATEALVIYFAGHGLLDPGNGDEFLLALPRADEEIYDNTLEYRVVSERLKNARAGGQIVILDCCFSGRALQYSMGRAAVPSLAIDGTCVLTATPPTQQALAPPGQRHTVFTGELLRLMERGVPDGPALLDMSTLYLWVRHALAEEWRERGLPRRPPLPDIANRKLGSQIALVKNRTPLQGPGVPAAPPPARAMPGPAAAAGSEASRPVPPARHGAAPVAAPPPWWLAPLARGVTVVAVVGALIAGIAFFGSGVGAGADALVDKIKALVPKQAPDPDDVVATGPPIRKVEGHGFRYEVIRTLRTTGKWGNRQQPAITVVAYVTRTSKSRYASMNYRFSDSASGAVLDGVPFQGTGDGEPPIGQRSRLVSVLWDTKPQSTAIDITLHDFYWPGDRNLVLRKVRVPAGS